MDVKPHKTREQLILRYNGKDHIVKYSRNLSEREKRIYKKAGRIAIMLSK